MNWEESNNEAQKSWKWEESENEQLKNDKYSEQNHRSNRSRSRDKSFSNYHSNSIRETRSNSDADKKELFVRNLSYNTNEDELKQFFTSFGDVSRVKILEKDGKSKGFGFVSFYNHEDPERILNDQQKLSLDGRTLQISWAEGNKNNKKDSNNFRGKMGHRFERNVRRNSNCVSDSSQMLKTVFVANLNYNLSENEIADFFCDCGKIINIRRQTDDKGRPKGFCHIDFEGENALLNALDKSGKELAGRQIRVEEATRRENIGRNQDKDHYRERNRREETFERNNEHNRRESRDQIREQNREERWHNRRESRDQSREQNREERWHNREEREQNRFTGFKERGSRGRGRGGRDFKRRDYSRRKEQKEDEY